MTLFDEVLVTFFEDATKIRGFLQGNYIKIKNLSRLIINTAAYPMSMVDIDRTVGILLFLYVACKWLNV